MFTLRKDDVEKSSEKVYPQTMTEKDDTQLLAYHDTMSAVSFMSTAIAEWLGLVPEVGKFDVLYTLAGPISITKRVKMPLRFTSTQVLGVWLTFYLHDRIPWADIILSSPDYILFGREGGRILRDQSAAMAQDAMREGQKLEDEQISDILEDAKEGKAAAYIVAGHTEYELHTAQETPSEQPVPAHAVVKATSPTKPKAQRGRGRGRAGKTTRGRSAPLDDPFITKDPRPATPTEEDMLYRPEEQVIAELQELLAVKVPRELWGWKDYYEHKAKKVPPPTPPPRYDPLSGADGAEVPLVVAR